MLYKKLFHKFTPFFTSSHMLQFGIRFDDTYINFKGARPDFLL